MKILFFYCGEGLGHTARAIAAGKALEKEHEVIYASYGNAREFGISSGLNVEEVPSEISLVGKRGQFDLSKSILTTISKSSKNPAGILKYYALIKKHNPDLVLSDSFFLPASIAKSKGIPTWMIIQLNQTNIDRFFAQHHQPMVRIAGKVIKQMNLNTLKQMDKILIPDFSPPFTIGKHSASVHPSIYEKIEFLGPLIRKQAHEMNTRRKRKTVYCAIGGFGYRAILLDKIIAASKELPNYKFNVVTYGPDAKVPPHGSNVKTYKQVVDNLPMINESSLVIAGSGHATAMDALCLGKPILSAPDAYHCEQEENADGVQRIGGGYRIDYKTSVATLKELIEELSTSKEYEKKLAMIQRIAQKNDGRKELVRLVKELEESKK